MYVWTQQLSSVYQSVPDGNLLYPHTLKLSNAFAYPYGPYITTTCYCRASTTPYFQCLGTYPCLDTWLRRVTPSKTNETVAPRYTIHGWRHTGTCSVDCTCVAVYAHTPPSCGVERQGLSVVYRHARLCLHFSVGRNNENTVSNQQNGAPLGCYYYHYCTIHSIIMIIMIIIMTMITQRLCWRRRSARGPT